MSPAPFQRILVPIDFTEDVDVTVHSGFEVETDGGKVAVAPASARSLELAASIVAPEGTLQLVHVTPSYDTARVYGGSSSMGVLGAQHIEAVHERAKKASLQVLGRLVERFAADATIELTVRPGVALNVILEEAERGGAELIVLAASGRGRVARFFLGSTADRIIRGAPCPVMVIPSQSVESSSS